SAYDDTAKTRARAVSADGEYWRSMLYPAPAAAAAATNTSCASASELLDDAVSTRRRLEVLAAVDEDVTAFGPALSLMSNFTSEPLLLLLDVAGIAMADTKTPLSPAARYDSPGTA
ncbi:hypothetical protein Vretifemale_15932, partial [Volvox reticuliferus]